MNGKSAQSMVAPILGCGKVIRATRGEKKILDSDVFLYKEDDFKNFTDFEESFSNEKTQTAGFKLVCDSKFVQIFTSISCNLDQLCLTQNQIIEFVRDNRKWMSKNCNMAFFLFRDAQNYFVAMVLIDANTAASVFVDPLGSKKVWEAKEDYIVIVRDDE